VIVESTGQPHASGSDLTVQIIETAQTLRDDMVSALQALVRIPSLTGEEAAVQDEVERIMRTFGLAVDRWEPDAAALAEFEEHVGAFETLANRPNVVGTWSGSGTGRSLILNAHIDTVETGDPSQWTHEPFGAEIDEDRVYGRGSCDMKAGLVANLFAVRILQVLGYRPGGDVIVESVISEEDGGAGTVATILRGYRADAAIITEPTRLAIVPAQGGSLVFRIHVAGRSAHAAVRDEGVSAIEKAWLIHSALLDFERQRNATLDHPLYAPIANKIPINIGTMRAGAWPSSVPEFAIMEGRAGLVPGEDLQAFKAEFAAYVSHVALRDPWLADHPPVLEWFSGQFAPADVPLNTPVIGILSASHHSVTGTTPPIEAVTYGADMRHFIHQGGMPCVMYGPGDVRLAHYTDEFVPISELVTAAATLALTISEWCGIER
jgi:acetylornithine deacetylase